MSLKFLENLNDEQKQAVVYNDSNLRIIAGAGSGKTRVLTSKILYLITQMNVPSEKILAMTFTNKAANEIKERVEKQAQEIYNDQENEDNKISYNKSFISTFHTFCTYFLRREIHVLGLKSKFEIIDVSDRRKIFDKIYRKYKLTFKELSYSTINDFILEMKQIEIEGKQIDVHMLKKDDKIKYNIYLDYQAECVKSNFVDFDDLLNYTYLILKNNIEIRDKWRKFYKYILIDEFQDTSTIQWDIIKFISNKDTIITVVGDPDQTIYTWRGADPQLILNFDKELENVLTITLSKNYRSTRKILSLANNLIKNNKNRLPKELVSQNEGEEESIKFFHAETQEMESKWIIDEIAKLKKQKVQLKDIAIFYRSNFYSRSIEEAMIKNQNKFKIYGSISFYERKEIKDAIAYLKVVNDGSEMGMLRIINVPSRRIGSLAIEKFQELAQLKNKTMFDALLEYASEKTEKPKKDTSVSSNGKNWEIPDHILRKIVEFLNVILKAQAHIKENKKIHIMLKWILGEIKYLENVFKTSEKERIAAQENINELINSIKIWENNNPHKTLSDYIEEISLMTVMDSQVSDASALSLMTIHSSKGMEFDNVFITGFSEGVFPSWRTIEDDEKGDVNAMEEERRLAYVAITRAKKRLFLSESQSYFVPKISSPADLIYNTKTGNKKPSRFLKEMGQEVERIVTNLIIRDENGELLYEKDNNELKVGDKIKHATLGIGIIVDEDDDIISVKFENEKDYKSLYRNHKSIEKVFE